VQHSSKEEAANEIGRNNQGLFGNGKRANHRTRTNGNGRRVSEKSQQSRTEGGYGFEPCHSARVFRYAVFCNTNNPQLGGSSLGKDFAQTQRHSDFQTTPYGSKQLRRKEVKIMFSRRNRGQSRSGLGTLNIAYLMIRLMHDNPILPMVRNPYKLLKAAGLVEGQKVLEVGCGPGFFTIPAARIVGNEGHVYAIDVYPRAVERVKKKIEKEALKNVTAVCTNASKTGLPGGSVDLAFLFGLRYIAGGLENMISELHRVLKSGGSLSFEKTAGSEMELVEEVKRRGFTHTGKEGRIFLFKKKGV
jgi:protein-L-isoaspartate O-methyltransferase